MKIFISEKIDELCEKFGRTREEFGEFICCQTYALQGYYKCDVERFFGEEINEGWEEL